MTARVAVAVAESPAWLAEAVRQGGGEICEPAAAEALVWGFDEPAALGELLARAPQIRWVQLPAAGVEPFAGLVGDGRTWTSAKGAYSDAVAEHALALVLAGMRLLPLRAQATSWGEKGGRSLFGASLAIVGGGGIAATLLALLEPFRAEVTVVRLHPRDMAGARRVVPPEALREAVTAVDAVVLAAALTPATHHMIGGEELRAMGWRCWLVNVGRGRLVVTEALVEALERGWIAGAGLDVVDPEPLPPGHPLWGRPNCLITPHTANPPDIEREHLSRRIARNVRAWAEGAPLEGEISPQLGY